MKISGRWLYIYCKRHYILKITNFKKTADLLEPYFLEFHTQSSVTQFVWMCVRIFMRRVYVCIVRGVCIIC